MIDDRLAFVAQIALFMGVLGLGVMLGTALGVETLLESCGLVVGRSPCVDGARHLESVGYAAGGGGLVLLLVGGALDAFDEEVREVLA